MLWALRAAVTRTPVALCHPSVPTLSALLPVTRAPPVPTCWEASSRCACWAGHQKRGRSKPVDMAAAKRRNRWLCRCATQHATAVRVGSWSSVGVCMLALCRWLAQARKLPISTCADGHMQPCWLPLASRLAYSRSPLTVVSPPLACPATAQAEVGDPHRDAGYWGTSRMALEAALCLALQQRELDASGDVRKGGVLTPASGAAAGGG